jgi:hypothetical protein
MAASVSTLKLTQVQGVVRVSGDAADTGVIDLSVTLKKSTETVSTPIVNITRVHWFCDALSAVTVTRNSVDILHLHGSGYTDWYGFVENTENDQDISVAFASGSGVVILELSKVGGYGSQQHQGADGDLG